MIAYQDYCVADPDELETPAMLLFQDIMDHNIRHVCEIAGGGPVSGRGNVHYGLGKQDNMCRSSA